jgi:hypothetical protein
MQMKDSKEGIDIKVHGCNQCNFIAKHRRMLWSLKSKHHAKAIHKPEILMAHINSCGQHFMDSDITTGDYEVDDSVKESYEGHYSRWKDSRM